MAILEALEWIEQNKPQNNVICSDSAAALVALEVGSSSARPDLVIEILCCLLRIESSGCHVCFMWVPGHFGVEGNEVADRLARESLSKENIDLNVMTGKSECVSICNEKLELQWQNEWNQEQRGRHYFCLQPSVKCKKWRSMFGWKDEVVLTRLRLGHCCLASCLKVIGKHENGLCECGEMERWCMCFFLVTYIPVRDDSCL